MRGAVLYGPRDIRFEDRPEPTIIEPTDAIIRLSATCICGSDLWPYRGIAEVAQPTPMGHEYCGIAEEVGSAVRTVKPGQFVIGINLRGVWSCMKHELRPMERQGSGAIVNNASVGALTANPGIGSYIASKHRVVGLTRAAALEYIKHGIRVNAVNRGLIDTQVARDVVNGDEQAYAEIAKHVPIGRAGRPEQIASAVLWLCSPGASYVVGHALTVDGGMTVP